MTKCHSDLLVNQSPTPIKALILHRPHLTGAIFCICLFVICICLADASSVITISDSMRPQNACQRKTPEVKDKEKREREKTSARRKSPQKPTRKAHQEESQRRHLEAAVEAGQRRTLQLTATQNVPPLKHRSPYILLLRGRRRRKGGEGGTRALHKLTLAMLGLNRNRKQAIKSPKLWRGRSREKVARIV